jgi:hypothetical protein
VTFFMLSVLKNRRTSGATVTRVSWESIRVRY